MWHRSIGKLVALMLFLLATALSLNVVTGNPGGESSYAEEVSRNYDFKFGPNPFAPGNATSVTGTFIPG